METTQGVVEMALQLLSAAGQTVAEMKDGWRYRVSSVPRRTNTWRHLGWFNPENYVAAALSWLKQTLKLHE